MPILSLSIGSNINAVENIQKAVRALRSEFGNILCSPVYESETVGFSGDNFLNLVVAINTEQALPTIVSCLKGLEDRLGRNRRQSKFSGRTMDIDILCFGSETGYNCGMALPRDEITQNAFVLQPLADLLPQQCHPDSGKTYAQLWAEYDKSRQRLWAIPFEWDGV